MTKQAWHWLLFIGQSMYCDLFLESHMSNNFTKSTENTMNEKIIHHTCLIIGLEWGKYGT